jgi:hypothetical protein
MLAFGVKIKPVDSNDKPTTVLISEPFEDSEIHEIALAKLGGTRHQSAVQFVYDRRESVAIVTSQDGRVSVIEWDPEKNMVLVVQHAEFMML